MTSSGWYVVHTKRAGERTAEAELTRQGYSVYYPRLALPKRRRGRWCEAVVGLFPRYLFLSLDEGRQSLAPVRSTPGVSAVVQFGHKYAKVADSIIRALKDREDKETGLHRHTGSLPTPGSAVRIAAGPLEGFEGLFDRTSGADRVVVLLNLLGRCTRVALPIDAVMPSTVAPS